MRELSYPSILHFSMQGVSTYPASGAGNSRSDAGAEAISSRLHALVRLETPVIALLWGAPTLYNDDEVDVGRSC